MGKVKLLTDFKTAPPSEFMEGARIPESDQATGTPPVLLPESHSQQQDPWESEGAVEPVEETKEAGSRRREENSKWSHLPSLE